MRNGIELNNEDVNQVLNVVPVARVPGYRTQIVDVLHVVCLACPIGSAQAFPIAMQRQATIDGQLHVQFGGNCPLCGELKTAELTYLMDAPENAESGLLDDRTGWTD